MFFIVVFISPTATLTKSLKDTILILRKKRLFIVEQKNYPEVNECYLDRSRGMLKVRMVGYQNKVVCSVVVEDTLGNIKSLNINHWQNMQLIPCCKTSNNIRRTSEW